MCLQSFVWVIALLILQQSECNQYFAEHSELIDDDVINSVFVLKNGWNQTQDKQSATFLWISSPLETKGLRSGQVANQFPNVYEIGVKDLLIQNLLSLEFSLQNNNTPGTRLFGSIYDFFPRTYVISPSTRAIQQKRRFVADFKRTAEPHKEHQHLPTDLPPLQPSIDGRNNVWIAKPSRASKGKGIQLFSSLGQVTDILNNPPSEGYVFQKYIEKVHLIQNKKFEIRCYALVTSLQPLQVYLYKDMKFLLCSQNYTLNTSSLQDPFTHITNYAIQKSHGSFSTQLQDNQHHVHEFKEHLRKELHLEDSYFDEVFFPKLRKLVATSLSAWPKEGHRANSFQLLGFDVLVNEDLDPWLVEINFNPSLRNTAFNRKLIASMLDVVIEKKNSSEWDTVLGT